MSPSDVAKSADARVHRGLDSGLRKAFASPKLTPKHDSKAFMQRLEKALVATEPRTGIAETIGAYLGRFADALKANSYAVPRFASLVIIPVIGFVVYTSMNKPQPEATMGDVAMGNSGGMLHEEMAPDAGLESMDSQARSIEGVSEGKLASGYPAEKPEMRSMKAEAEFDQVAQETLTIQEDLLKKNLEMAPNAAAKKSALAQLLDFYKKSGMKEKAQSIEREIEQQKR
ncbi:MAG: hypothetical protein K8S54_04010 [Spirochaetia bacterium]|nr:hypothetical protein [Spirochaetia bacterium]